MTVYYDDADDCFVDSGTHDSDHPVQRQILHPLPRNISPPPSLRLYLLPLLLFFAAANSSGPYKVTTLCGVPRIRTC